MSACRSPFFAEMLPHPITVAPQQRQSVVAELSFGGRRVSLEAVRPVPEHLEATAVPYDRIKRCQKANHVFGA